MKATDPEARRQEAPRFTPHTAVLWIVTTLVRIGLGFGAGPMLGIKPRPGGIWLALAVTLGAQRVVMFGRLRHKLTPGRPCVLQIASQLVRPCGPGHATGR